MTIRQNKKRCATSKDIASRHDKQLLRVSGRNACAGDLAWFSGVVTLGSRPGLVEVPLISS